MLYFPHQVIIKNESLSTKQQTVCDASACERRVLKEEMGSEKSDEDMELPQATEKVIPLESERAKMLSVGPDAMAQPVTAPEEKCLPRALLISADEMCEEKAEGSVNVIKETAKEDINPVVLNTSSNVLFVHHHWRKYSQVQRGVGKPTLKLPFIQRSVVMRKRSTMRKKNVLSGIFDTLTPGHFLVGHPITTIAEPSLTEVSDNRMNYRDFRLQFLQESKIDQNAVAVAQNINATFGDERTI
ncbi:splicing factor 3B subunit 2 [Trichonephila clavipes]|nr:splicing factor 3B subunit 2 [Trichonephila clavipes]